MSSWFNFIFLSCFSYNCCLYDYNEHYYAIYIMFRDLWIMDMDHDHNQWFWIKNVWIDLVYKIIVIFCKTNGYKMLDDHFYPIYGNLGYLLKWE